MHNWLRAYGQGGLAMCAIMRGRSDEEVLGLVKKYYPNARTGPNSLATYKTTLWAMGFEVPEYNGATDGVGQAVCDAIFDGLDDDAAVQAVLKRHGRSRLEVGRIRQYRGYIREAGFVVPEIVEA